MRVWTFPFGRYFGVEVRIHSFFALMLLLCFSFANIIEVNLGRGFGLGMFLLLAVFVREMARTIVGAWFSWMPASMVLLPTGALTIYAGQDAQDNRETLPVLQTSRDREIDETEQIKPSPDEEKKLRIARIIALTGPLANLGFGVILGAFILTVSPQVNLLQTPWISPAHLLRALVWVNLLLGAVNLLPAWPLDGALIFRSPRPSGSGRATPSRIGTGTVIGLALIVGGMLAPNMWLLMIGIFVLIATQFEDPGRPVAGAASKLTMRDVMMEDYTVLSASATLEDAMRHATHTLQDVFPVVRGGNLVGAVSRQHIAEALSAGGNSYVQGIMTRSFRTAHAGDPLMKTLRKIMAPPGLQGAQLVPILAKLEADGGDIGERIVGIVTPQNLQRSMTVLEQSLRIQRTSDFNKERDRM